MKTHCQISNAGLYYENYYEFKEIIQFMNMHNKVYEIMKINGCKYVNDNYSWNKIIDKYDTQINIE